MKLNSYNLKKYLQCDNYYNLDQIRKKKTMADIFLTDEIIKKILTKMYDKDGESLIKESNASSNNIIYFKNSFEKWIKMITNEEILVNKEYTTQLGTIELICDFDCVLELMDKNIFVRTLPITKKSLFKKISLDKKLFKISEDEIFHQVSKIFCIDYLNDKDGILWDLFFSKYVYEQSHEYNEYKDSYYYIVVLDEEKENFFDVYDFTSVLQNDYFNIEESVNDFKQQLENKNVSLSNKCLKKTCKFYNVCVDACLDNIEEKEYINKDKIINELNSIQYPIYYLDFETYSSAYPRFIGEKPYSNYVFMYTLIKQEDESSDLIYKSYIVKDNFFDYRLNLFEQLIQDVGKEGTIIVYNESFEKSRIKEAAHYFPHLSKSLNDINNRIYDLLYLLKGNKSNRNQDYINNNYYNTLLKGSYSIKKVLPLFGEEDYSVLEIKNGIEASESYGNFHLLNEEELEEEKNNLIKYCEKDTYGMYVILKGIKEKIKTASE